MDNIINGQLWIDKNSPYRLKYTANDTIYSVDVSSDYFITSIPISESNPLRAGTIVAFKEGGIRKAVFPDDIDNVIGVIGNTITSANQPVSILKTGIITLTKDEFTKIFESSNSDFSDIWNTIGMKGAPVYWFIGKELATKNAEDINEYSYYYDKSNYGQATLLTPTGRRWKRVVNNNSDIDCSFNVSYDNLPIIGYIDSIKSANNEWTSVDIYLNVNKFDTTLEWSWPFDNNYTLSGETITIRHGLFPKSFKDFSNYNFRQRNACTIIALDKGNNSDNEYEVSANVQNYYGQNDEQNPDDDPRTVIFDLSNSYRYRITGTVNLKFDRKINNRSI